MPKGSPRRTKPPSLKDRLQKVEDQLAIYQVISSYGPAADSCHMEDLEKHCDEDSIYELADIGIARGWPAIKALFDSPFHQGVVKGGSAHIASLPYVIINGDHAVATHYTQLFAHKGNDFVCLRLSVHRWELVRSPKGWVMRKRSTALLNGDARARDLLYQNMWPLEADCGGSAD